MTDRAAALRMHGVGRAFGPVVALDDFDLEVESGTMLALLGPSGCGKTTALRIVAGFERPDSGTVEIRGRRVASPTASVPPERRRVGVVFQDFALFPHLTVRDNVAYGVRRDPDHRIRVDELLDLVGLRGEARRMPHELSGGMQQRVALARALAPRPDLVLLDEPFSNLDQALRTQLSSEVREILRESRQTAVFVTHDQAEALTIADHVAVMARGHIEQVAPPELVYAEPSSPFVATFVGVANLVHAECHGGVAATRFGAARLVGPRRQRPEGRALVLLRPEHFAVREALDGPADQGSWEVVARRFSGSEILLEVRADDGQRVWVEAGDRVRRVGRGDRVVLTLREVETVAFPPSVGPAGRLDHREDAVIAGPASGPGWARHGQPAGVAAEESEPQPGSIAVEPPVH